MKNFNVSKTTTKTKDENEDERRRRRRKTKTASIEKEQKKVKTFSNKCVSSQKIRMRKEEGATVGVCRPFCSLPSLSGPFRYFRLTGRTGSVLPWSSPNHRENLINYRKCPTFDAERTNERTNERTKNRRFSDSSD
jgi:hypothetical protein